MTVTFQFWQTTGLAVRLQTALFPIVPSCKFYTHWKYCWALRCADPFKGNLLKRALRCLKVLCCVYIMSRWVVAWQLTWRFSSGSGSDGEEKERFDSDIYQKVGQVIHLPSVRYSSRKRKVIFNMNCFDTTLPSVFVGTPLQFWLLGILQFLCVSTHNYLGHQPAFTNM